MPAGANTPAQMSMAKPGADADTGSKFGKVGLGLSEVTPSGRTLPDWIFDMTVL